MVPSAVDRVIPGSPLANDGDLPLDFELHRRSGLEAEPHAYRHRDGYLALGGKGASH